MFLLRLTSDPLISFTLLGAWAGKRLSDKQPTETSAVIYTALGTLARRSFRILLSTVLIRLFDGTFSALSCSRRHSAIIAGCTTLDALHHPQRFATVNRLTHGELFGHYLPLHLSTESTHHT